MRNQSLEVQKKTKTEMSEGENQLNKIIIKNFVNESDYSSFPKLNNEMPQFQINLKFVLKRSFEERIHKSFNEELKHDRLDELLKETQKQQRKQFNNIKDIDSEAQYYLLNQEKIVKSKLKKLSQLHHDQLHDCKEQVPNFEHNLELFNTGFISDSHQLRSFKKMIQKRGMIFSNDNQFEQSLMCNLSLGQAKIQKKNVNKLIDNQRLQTEGCMNDNSSINFDAKHRSISYNAQQMGSNHRTLQSKNQINRHLNFNFPQNQKTMSTAESNGSQAHKKIQSDQIKLQRQRTFRTAVMPSIPLYPVDINVEDPNIFKLFHNISQKRQYTFPQQLEISRSQFEKYLNKILLWDSLTARALNFLQFHPTITFHSYKKWLASFNRWTHDTILFFSFHLFDTQRKGVLEANNLMNLLKYKNTYEEDILKLLSYNQFPQTTNMVKEQCSRLLQQPELTYSLYRQYLQQDQVKSKQIEENRKKKQRPFTFTREDELEIKRIYLKDTHRSKSFKSPVKELYEDTKQVSISFSQFCAVYEDSVPRVFICLIQAVSLRQILTHQNVDDHGSFIKISQDL